MEHLDTDVVVVGAGFAGLTAADRLAQLGVDVVVLEARDRVGGRAHTRRLGDGITLDFGGQWIGPTQDEIAALANRLGAQVFPTYSEGATLFDRGTGVVRYRGTVPRVSPRILADLAQVQRRLYRMLREVPLDEPWRTTAPHWDTQTAETWLRRHMYTRAGRDLMDIAVTSLFAAEPSDLSLLHMLFYLRSGGGPDLMLEVAGGAQESRFVNGAQDLAERLAAQLPRRVCHNAAVRALHQGADRVTARCDTQTVTARRAVIAIPPALASRIAYQPALPSNRDGLTQRMPMGSVIKIMAVYDEPFWRADGLNGQVTSTPGPLHICFDNSPPSGKPGVLLTFLEGREALRLGPADVDDRRATVLSCLTRWFGPRAARPADYLELDWTTEEWTRGCYGAHLAPGVWTRYGPALRRPIGLLHWAGAETSPLWNGYMDGAIRSGQRVAAEVAEALR